MIKLWFAGHLTSQNITNYGNEHYLNTYLYKKHFINNRFHRNDYEVCFKFTKKQFHKYFEYDKYNHRWQLKPIFVHVFFANICNSYEIFNLEVS